MIFDRKWNRISVEQFVVGTKSENIIIFGMSPRNKEILDLVQYQNIQCFYDNNPEKWGCTPDGIAIKKPMQNTTAVIVTAVEDYVHLIPQFDELGYQKRYFFMRESSYAERYKGYIENFAGKPENYSFIRRNRAFKYVHIFSDNKFILPTIDIIERAFDMKEHAFIIYGLNVSNSNDKYGNWKKLFELSEKYGNVIITDSDSNFNNIDNKHILEGCREHFERCEKIFFHGEWLNELIRDFFSEQKNLQLVKEKGFWLIWSGSVGTDVCNRDNIELVLKYCKGVLYGTEFEKNQLLQNYCMKNAHWILTRASYTWLIDRPKSKSNGKNVLIGHSCYSYNRNVEALKALEKFSGELDIYCIISYGAQDCIDEVVSLGHQIYGERFHAVDKFFPYPEYVAFLNEMDVVAYAMDTAASYTTLQLLFWLNKKVYLKKDSGIDAMTKECGYHVHDFYHIEGESLEEFMYSDETEHNFEISKTEFDNEERIGQWRELFEWEAER